MSARTIAAAAVMTAAFAGPATAQHAMPMGDAAGGSPYYGGGPALPPGYPGDAIAAPGGGCAPGMPGGPLDDISQLRGPRSWVGAEYLLYWTKNMPISSPLATGGPASGFATLGAAGTGVVLGNQDVDFREQHGLRVSGGTWLTDTFGFEGSAFLLPTKNYTLGPVGATDVLPTLARPFFDANQRIQNVRLLAKPNTFTGGVAAEATTSLWGGDAAAVLRMAERGPFTLDGMLGFKHVSLEESLDINDTARAGVLGVANFNGTAFRTGTTTYVNDHFGTANRIYAGMLGSRLNLYMDAFTLSIISKVSLGVNEQSVSADGSTIVTGPFVAPAKVGGGLLAAGPNVGKFTRSEFVYVPEMNVNLSCQLTPHLTISLGYNFLYISSVVRPGDQLGAPINPVYVPTSANFGGRFGPLQPSTLFSTSSYWANGLNLGLSVGY